MEGNKEAESPATPAAPAAPSAPPSVPAAPATPAAPAAPAAQPEEPAPPPPPPSPKYKVLPLFGKYSFEGIKLSDTGLQKYLSYPPVFVPHTFGRHATRSFGKRQLNVVERLINGLMRTEHSTGEKNRTYRMVKEAFAIIEKRTKENPIQVLINAIQNAAPREEITRLKYGGISVPKAVDTSPARRVDVAIRNICRGAMKSSKRNPKRIELCLADEIMLAAKKDLTSHSISKKEETERVASSAR